MPTSLASHASRMLYVLSARNFEIVYADVRSRLETLTKATDDSEGEAAGLHASFLDASRCPSPAHRIPSPTSLLPLPRSGQAAAPGPHAIYV